MKKSVMFCRSMSQNLFDSYMNGDKLSSNVIKTIARFLSLKYGYTTVNQITQEILSIYFRFDDGIDDGLTEFSYRESEENAISQMVRDCMHTEKVRKEFLVYGDEKSSKQYVWVGKNYGKGQGEITNDEEEE